VEDDAPVSPASAITAIQGQRAEAASEFRGEMHLALLNGMKYLDHSVTFDTRIHWTPVP
jgi:hypothetical protein